MHYALFTLLSQGEGPAVVSGSTVTAGAGIGFNATNVGHTITLGGNAYLITAVTSANTITIANPPASSSYTPWWLNFLVPAGVTQVLVRAIGGGGGGGGSGPRGDSSVIYQGCAGAGGAGALRYEGWFGSSTTPVIPPTGDYTARSIHVVIGKGGTAGAGGFYTSIGPVNDDGGNGGNGNPTSFGGTDVAFGGQGGQGGPARFNYYDVHAQLDQYVLGGATGLFVAQSGVVYTNQSFPPYSGTSLPLPPGCGGMGVVQGDTTSFTTFPSSNLLQGMGTAWGQGGSCPGNTLVGSGASYGGGGGGAGEWPGTDGGDGGAYGGFGAVGMDGTLGGGGGGAGPSSLNVSGSDGGVGGQGALEVLWWA